MVAGWLADCLCQSACGALVGCSCQMLIDSCTWYKDLGNTNIESGCLDLSANNDNESLRLRFLFESRVMYILSFFFVVMYPPSIQET